MRKCSLGFSVANCYGFGCQSAFIDGHNAATDIILVPADIGIEDVMAPSDRAVNPLNLAQ